MLVILAHHVDMLAHVVLNEQIVRVGNAQHGIDCVVRDADSEKLVGACRPTRRASPQTQGTVVAHDRHRTTDIQSLGRALHGRCATAAAQRDVDASIRKAAQSIDRYR
eukprot:1914708-Prymnesium_polylepis.1